MRFRGLTIAAAAAALAAGGASVLHGALGEPRDRLVIAATMEPAAGHVSNGRVHLTADQVDQTRDPAHWPEEVRSLLSVDGELRHGEWLWNDRGVPKGRPTVRVDLRTQLISVVRGGHEIGTAVILYGANSHATPLGRFPVLSKAADYRSRTYDAPMPFTLRLTPDGVALHGSDVRSGRATHGCIGLPLEFARRLFEQVEPGDEVLILRS